MDFDRQFGARTQYKPVSIKAHGRQPPREQHSSRYFDRTHEEQDAFSSQYDASPMYRGDTLSELPDEDPPLDDFDRRLLSRGQNPVPFHPPQTPSHVSLQTFAYQASRTTGTRSQIQRDHSIHHAQQNMSSSPSRTASSPLVDAVHKRPSQGYTANITNTGYVRPAYSGMMQLAHAPPNIQGITLVPKTDLPDRFQAIFSYDVFNAVQSKCFPAAFNTDDNIVLSAPTGCGKTVVMELAICRLVSSFQDENFKIVYQAPTKALCAERARDWQKKFAPLSLECAELTGDTETDQLRSVQQSRIIITTPEKWDSVTRRWKDNAKLMELVKLFLIDEVHILKESRGATLEAVVSRMKSVGSKVRFVALSATIPNSEDIAAWLGRCPDTNQLPAHREVFGEEFRPVKLEKLVQSFQSMSNDWAFESMLSSKIPEMIARYSKAKPTMIFSPTRKSAIKMAQQLAELWTATNPNSRLWHGPKTPATAEDLDLRNTIAAGVAFHHGGLSISDRRSVEEGFLNGNVMVICCTSTLAVGVNLPCYLVIIKGTKGWTEGGLKTYPDLEIMQMLGRAGRPQFEKSACAVIMTRDEERVKYDKMVSGTDILESCLHQNLIDHLNAEIGLGTIYDLSSAKTWLKGTFLFVRLQRNPKHYRLERDMGQQQHADHDVLLQTLCEEDVKLLQQSNLITSQPRFHITELGDAMARYCVKFETMKIILAIPPKAKVEEILMAITQAVEFKEVRLRAGEKTLYKEMNKDESIKFPIKVDLSQSHHKVSLIVQAELGACLYPSADTLRKYRTQYLTDRTVVFNQVHRLARCIVDCQLHHQDAVAARNALSLARSLSARVWDHSPMELKQIEGIGDVGMRKLAAADVRSIAALADTEAHRIEMILGRNPPFGNQMLSRVSDFPILRINVKQTGKKHLPSRGAQIEFAADIGFMNTKPPFRFRRDAVYVCFLAESQDGTLLDFRRMSARKIHASPTFSVVVVLEKLSTLLRCYVSCDGIAGTSRDVELRLEAMPASWFPSPVQVALNGTDGNLNSHTDHVPNVATDDLFDDDIDDAELLSIDIDGRRVEVIHDIDKVIDEIPEVQPKPDKQSRKRTASNLSIQNDKEKNETIWKAPTQLSNGNWTCQHDCRAEGKQCNHKCCKEGVANPRKYPRNKPSKVKPEDASESSAPAATQKARGVNAGASGATKKQAKRQTEDSPDSRKMLRIEPVKNRNAVPCLPFEASYEGPESTNTRKLTSNEDHYHLVTGFDEADWNTGDVSMELRDPWARQAISTTTTTTTKNALSSDGDFWKSFGLPGLTSTTNEKEGVSKTQEDVSMVDMIDEIPGIDDLLAGNIEDDLFDEEVALPQNSASLYPRAAEKGTVRSETHPQTKSSISTPAGNVTNVSDQPTRSMSDDNHNDNNFEDFDFDIEWDNFENTVSKLATEGKATHRIDQDNAQDDMKARAHPPNPKSLDKHTKIHAAKPSAPGTEQERQATRPRSPDPFYAADLKSLLAPSKPTAAVEREEEDQRQKWAGIRLAPAFENLKDFVHLI